MAHILRPPSAANNANNLQQGGNEHRGLDYSILEEHADTAASQRPTNANENVDPNIPATDAGREEAEHTQDSEREKDDKKLRDIKLKLFGYYMKLPELVRSTFVEWPNPITAISQYTLEQAEELYEQCLQSVAVMSQGGGTLMHNAACQFIETGGISMGYKLNGFSEEMRLETIAKNLTERLRQLVAQLEIEHGLGIKNPLLEYAAIMMGAAAHRHHRLTTQDANLFFEQQQHDEVPPGLVNDFSHL